MNLYNLMFEDIFPVYSNVWKCECVCISVQIKLLFYWEDSDHWPGISQNKLSNQREERQQQVDKTEIQSRIWCWILLKLWLVSWSWHLHNPIFNYKYFHQIHCSCFWLTQLMINFLPFNIKVKVMNKEIDEKYLKITQWFYKTQSLGEWIMYQVILSCLYSALSIYLYNLSKQYFRLIDNKSHYNDAAFNNKCISMSEQSKQMH